MKNIFLSILMVMSLNAFGVDADSVDIVKFRCANQDAQATPYDIFFIEMAQTRRTRNFSVGLIRKQNVSDTQVPEYQKNIKACELSSGRYAEWSEYYDGYRAYVECDLGGALSTTFYLGEKKETNKITASIYFGNGNIGYAKGSRLELTCIRL